MPTPTTKSLQHPHVSTVGNLSPTWQTDAPDMPRIAERTAMLRAGDSPPAATDVRADY